MCKVYMLVLNEVLDFCSVLFLLSSFKRGKGSSVTVSLLLFIFPVAVASVLEANFSTVLNTPPFLLQHAPAHIPLVTGKNNEVSLLLQFIPGFHEQGEGEGGGEVMGHQRRWSAFLAIASCVAFLPLKQRGQVCA